MSVTIHGTDVLPSDTHPRLTHQPNFNPSMKHIIFITLLAAPFFTTSCVINPCGVPDQPLESFIAQADGGANDARLPDPRYRRPLGIWEIDRVASMVAKATGRPTSGTITVSDESPLARIRGPLDSGEIQINPRAAATIPPNSWAFIIGHEFAHRTHGLSSPNGTDPETEAEADAIGARYAMAAGFDLAAHIDWTLTHFRDGWSPSHGSTHQRAFRLAERFGISSPRMW